MADELTREGEEALEASLVGGADADGARDPGDLVGFAAGDL